MDRLHPFLFLSAAALAALLVVAPARRRRRRAAAEDARAPGAGPRRTGELSAELMYRLLVGDIALQRGEPALAARAYYEAAREARDPRFARRATEIALAARQRTLALDAATLWAELDPTAERAEAGRRGPQGRRRLFAAADLKARPRAGARRRRGGRAAAGRSVPGAQPGARLRAGQGGDVQARQCARAALSQQAEAQFAVALAAYNTGLADFESSTVALQAIDRALALKPDWEQAMLLKVEILGKQSMDRAADYLVEVLRAQPDAKPLQFGARAGAHRAEALRRSAPRFCRSSRTRTRAITSTSSASRCSRCR